MSQHQHGSRRRRPLTLEALEDRALLSASGLAPTPPAIVQAQSLPASVPFVGPIQGVGTITAAPTQDAAGNFIVPVHVTATANIDGLGTFALDSDHRTVILASTGYTRTIIVGSGTLTASNGDRINISYVGTGVLNAVNAFDDTFVFVVTGGTGRYANAAGGGIIRTFDQASSDRINFPFTGAIDGRIFLRRR